MYGLFYHVNVPLIRGHLVNADSGQRTGYFGFLSLLRQTVIIILVIFFHKIFYFQNGDGQTALCVVGKTMFYRGFGYKAVGRGSHFSAAKWACLNLLRIALTILKNNVNERMSTCCLFDTAADISR